MTTDASFSGDQDWAEFREGQNSYSGRHRQHIEAEVVHNSGEEQVAATDSSLLHVCHPYLDWPRPSWLGLMEIVFAATQKHF